MNGKDTHIRGLKVVGPLEYVTSFDLSPSDDFTDL
jgi:hypothetical protein